MISFNEYYEGTTIDTAWQHWFSRIQELQTGESLKSRDGDVVGEILNAVTVIEDPTRNVLLSKIRKLPMRYLIGELLWYQSGNDELRAIQNYTSAWDRMSDDGITVNSNYGAIIQNCIDWVGEPHEFDQYEYVKELLLTDHNTRQAVIHIKTPRDTRVNPTKDLNCTVCLQFFVRSDGGVPKLYMTTYMRSNDLWMGFPNDVFQFTCIQIRLAMELGVGIGSYTHIAGSLHMYQRDYEKALHTIESEATCWVDGVPAIQTKERKTPC